jgi:hypothetical protein
MVDDRRYLAQDRENLVTAETVRCTELFRRRIVRLQDRHHSPHCG